MLNYKHFNLADWCGMFDSWPKPPSSTCALQPVFPLARHIYHSCCEEGKPPYVTFYPNTYIQIPFSPPRKHRFQASIIPQEHSPTLRCTPCELCKYSRQCPTPTWLQDRRDVWQFTCPQTWQLGGKSIWWRKAFCVLGVFLSWISRAWGVSGGCVCWFWGGYFACSTTPTPSFFFLKPICV